MPAIDLALAILQTAVALAGLLLVFSGFLFSKAASFDTKRGDKFKLLAKCSLLPILTALALAWMSVEALTGSPWAGQYLMDGLKVMIGVTAIFAVVGILAGAP